jgi:hypothetical protein
MNMASFHHADSNVPCHRLSWHGAVVVEEGATVTALVAKSTTMIIVGLILLNVFGIGLFCSLMFTLAVYALPFSIGLSASIAALHGGAGVIGALLVGIFAGGLTLGIGQIAFAIVRPLVLRAIIAATFAVPAAIAGYHVILGLSQIGVPSLVWRQLFASMGAVFIGATAWARMTLLAEPLSLRPGGASQNVHRAVQTAATEEHWP